MESQFAAPSARADVQRTELARLVLHAREHVPFYENRLDPIFSVSGDIDWDRWEDLPITRRSDLLMHGNALLSRNPPASHGRIRRASTTGSTGPSVTVSHTDHANLVLSATIFRAHTWHRLDWSGHLLAWLGDDPLRAPFPDGEIGPAWGPPWVEQATGKALRLNRYSRAEDVLGYIERHGISYFTARPKGAQFLALEAIRLGKCVGLDAVMGFSTAILPDERDDCLRAFGARLFGPYSSKEAHHIAYQCPTGKHFHVNEETILVEIIDDQGRSCEPGEVGRVIVTPLFNFAQPLIRYEQGDIACFGEPCACGRTLKVVERIVGRTMHLFRFPDGTRVAPTIPKHLMSMLGAQFWQIAQTEPLTIEVRYVPVNERIGDEQAVADGIRQRTHPEAHVTFRRVADVARADGGKFIEFVCELEPEGSGAQA